MKVYNIITLPVYLLSILQNATSTWNIVKIAFGKDNKNHMLIDNNTTLKVFYPKGSYSPSKEIVGGIGFFASPQNIFMAEEVILNYEVKFDDTFNPMFGGKLPGLFISNGTSKYNMNGASGGKHSNSSSCRIAWRSELNAEAYIYLPTREQHLNYFQIPNLIQNPVYGDSLWRGIFKFIPNDWNYVSIRLKVNSIQNKIPQMNGELEISINNTTQRFDKLIWRVSEDYLISAILFETFFGGSTIQTATPNDTWTYFRNVTIQKV